MFDEQYFNPLARRGEVEKSPVLRELECEMSFPSQEDKNKAIEKTTSRLEAWEEGVARLRESLAKNQQQVTGKGLCDDIYLKIIKALEDKILKEDAVVNMLRENLKDLTATEREDLIKTENEILNMPVEDRVVAKEALARELLGRKFRELDINDEYSRLENSGRAHGSPDDIKRVQYIQRQRLNNELAASEKERARLNDLIEKYKNN